MSSQTKFYFLFAVLCVSVLVLMQPANAQQCGPDEVAVKCTTACNTRCPNVPIACGPPCNPGCECKPGLLRNLSDKCVAEAQC